MSAELYERCLYWGGLRGGVAKVNGTLIKLTAPPVILGMIIVGIEYMPEVGVARVQPYAAGWRDMMDTEVAAADAILAALCHQDRAGGATVAE